MLCTSDPRAASVRYYVLLITQEYQQINCFLLNMCHQLGKLISGELDRILKKNNFKGMTNVTF